MYQCVIDAMSGVFYVISHYINPLVIILVNSSGSVMQELSKQYITRSVARLKTSLSSSLAEFPPFKHVKLNLKSG